MIVMCVLCQYMCFMKGVGRGYMKGGGGGLLIINGEL